MSVSQIMLNQLSQRQLFFYNRFHVLYNKRSILQRIRTNKYALVIHYNKIEIVMDACKLIIYTLAMEIFIKIAGYSKYSTHLFNIVKNL